jgi:hypothetical protein
VALPVLRHPLDIESICSCLQMFRAREVHAFELSSTRCSRCTADLESRKSVVFFRHIQAHCAS